MFNFPDVFHIKIKYIHSSNTSINTSKKPSGCFLEVFIDVLEEYIYYILVCIFIHLVVCLTTGPKPLPKLSSPHSAIQSFLLQMRVSSPFFKVIQQVSTPSSLSSCHFYPPLYLSFNNPFQKAVSTQNVTNPFCLPFTYFMQDIPLFLDSKQYFFRIFPCSLTLNNTSSFHVYIQYKNQVLTVLKTRCFYYKNRLLNVVFMVILSSLVRIM